MKQNFTSYFAASLLLSAFCFLPHSNAFAQNSFPTSNAIWNESVRGVCSIYGLFGDTTINKLSYNKLYLLSDTLLVTENLQRYMGGLRNEGKKVWFKPADWTYPDILLYDFGVSVGDTVWHNAAINYWHIDIDSNSFSVILSITTLNNRKKYNIYCPSRNWWNNEWIEGIGSYRGLLNSLMPNYPLFWSFTDFTLHCFKHNDTVKYPNYYPCNCFCPTQVRISDKELHSDFICIYPNVAKDILNVQITERCNIESIFIYGIDGKLVEKYGTYQNNLIQLNVSNLKKGNYIININTNNGIFSKLIIKE